MPADNDILQTVGDVCGPIVLALGTPSGPDSAARFTIAPNTTYSGVTLIFEKAVTKVDFDAGIWTALSSVVRQDTFNVLPNGVASGLTNLTLDFVAPSLYGLYAIRCRLSAISAGALSVQGVTTPRSLTDPGAFMAKMALELTRIRLGISELTGVELQEIAAADSI